MTSQIDQSSYQTHPVTAAVQPNPRTPRFPPNANPIAMELDFDDKISVHLEFMNKEMCKAIAQTVLGEMREAEKKRKERAKEHNR